MEKTWSLFGGLVMKKNLLIITLLSIAFCISISDIVAVELWKTRPLSDEVKKFFREYFVNDVSYSREKLFHYEVIDGVIYPSIESQITEQLRPIFISDEDHKRREQLSITAKLFSPLTSQVTTENNLYWLVEQFLRNVSKNGLTTKERLNAEITDLEAYIKSGRDTLGFVKSELEMMKDPKISERLLRHDKEVSQRKTEIKKLLTSKENPLDSLAGLAALVYEYSDQDEKLELFWRQIALRNDGGYYKEYFLYGVIDDEKKTRVPRYFYKIKTHRPSRRGWFNYVDKKRGWLASTYDTLKYPLLIGGAAALSWYNRRAIGRAINKS